MILYSLFKWGLFVCNMYMHVILISTLSLLLILNHLCDVPFYNTFYLTYRQAETVAWKSGGKSFSSWSFGFTYYQNFKNNWTYI